MTARRWLVAQDFQDGISEEEAKLVSRIYWKQHKNEYRFFGGALGEPEDENENWFIPYFYGTGRKRSDQGIHINKLTGECSHPKLQGNFAHILIEKEIEKIDIFIANTLSTSNVLPNIK